MSKYFNSTISVLKNDGSYKYIFLFPEINLKTSMVNLLSWKSNFTCYPSNSKSPVFGRSIDINHIIQSTQSITPFMKETNGSQKYLIFSLHFNSFPSQILTHLSFRAERQVDLQAWLMKIQYKSCECGPKSCSLQASIFACIFWLDNVVFLIFESRYRDLSDNLCSNKNTCI